MSFLYACYRVLFYLPSQIFQGRSRYNGSFLTQRLSSKIFGEKKAKDRIIVRFVLLQLAFPNSEAYVSKIQCFLSNILIILIISKVSICNLFTNIIVPMLSNMQYVIFGWCKRKSSLLRIEYSFLASRCANVISHFS